MTDCVANAHGLVFSISPVKKQPKSKKDEEEEENILTLAPFTKPPKINFGQLKINDSVERSVLLINPQQFDLDLVVTNNELNINNIQLKIEKGKNINLKITWRPEKPGNFKFAILFEVTNSARLKFLVHAFGVCVKPEEKKPIRKPLNMLQPLKKKSESTTIQKKETLLSTKYKSTTTTTTTIYKKSAGQKSRCDETVIIEKSGNKENNKNLGLTIEAVSDTRKDSESKSLKSIYDDSFSEPQVLDSTPKFSEFNTPTQSTAKVQLTPKLSDFIKPPSYPSDQSPNIVTTMTKVTKIAATKFIDISIEHDNPLNSKTVIDDGPKTPHFPNSKFNTNYSGSSNYGESMLELDSIYKKTPKLDRKYLYKEEFIDKLLVEKYAIVCQKKWRYKMFQRKLREIKLRTKTERLSELLAGSKGLALEFEMLNKKQDELVIQQQLEKQRKDLLLIEMERKEQERKENILKYVIMCQRAIRIKRFRKFFRQYQQNMLNRSVVLVQRKWRLIKFRKCLNMLKLEKQMKIERQIQINKYAVICQRWFRYKKFRKCLTILVEEEQNLRRQTQAVCVVQKRWRMYKFRLQMKKYRSAALTIQSWYRNCLKPRNHFLLIKKYTLKIQAVYRYKAAKRTRSALIIQSNYRAFIQKKKFNILKKSVTKIENWYHSKQDRIRFLKLKRSIAHVQCKCRQLLSKQNQAAMTIQKAYSYYKFRRQMKMYRQSIVAIQRWSRSMKLRYQYLEYKRIVVKSTVLIQRNWRIYLTRREIKKHLSAVMIQKVWRGHWARKNFQTIREKLVEEQELAFLNECATKIQSSWRGFLVRKATTQVLCSIRSRLSFYQINTSSESSTLGSRIKNSLKILNYPCVPIQQIILALTDLDKVTRLSPECCLIFTREGAIEILYQFIMNCNRSVPHMDLVKLCLQILINLSKYSQTVEYILSPAGSCLLLLNLLQAYQSSNPSIFMDACIIFILLSQHEAISEFILRQDNFIKKITSIHSILERRATFTRDRQTSKGCLIGKDQLNSTLNIGLNSNSKKTLVLSFSYMPEWSLAKKKSIELVEPLGALEFMMKNLGIEIETFGGQLGKTPKKSLSSSAIDKSGKKSSAKPKSAYQAKQKTHLSKPTNKQLFKESQEPKVTTYSTFRMENFGPEQLFDPEFDDDHFSITSNESYRSVSSVTTVKSISNLNSELPKLNSTIASSNNSKRKCGMKKSESVNFS